MNIQLINKPNPNWSTAEQIFYNRGIPQAEIKHYVNLTDADINEPELLGISSLEAGIKIIVYTIKNDLPAMLIVDCDCDGYTSAALLINYLHKIFPSWVENKLTWSMHESKDHGLSDQIEMLRQHHYGLVICPDSASNDYEFHKELDEQKTAVLVLDHHLAEHVSENAIIINNQLSNYPNKELSGVGVTWQFCRYFDKKLGTNYTDDLLDLVALGNCSDMMSLRSFETRRLITRGFKKENIKNPFIEYMIDKNSFPLSKPDYKSHYSTQACTSMGAAFFIVPFVNAVTRSGTLQEKELIFDSMLNHKAFQRIPEIKRNKLTGKEELLVLQAVRVIGNVKNRQTRAEEASLARLEKKIEDNHMLENHRILLFLLEPSEIEPEIRGLIANKFMAKYQRPCAILSHKITPVFDEDGNEVGQKESYEGSMRGYTKNGLDSFKGLLEQCPGVLYVEGHENAAGLGVAADQVDEFLATADKLMENVSAEPIYRVDYFFKNPSEQDNQKILDISALNDYWGQDVDRAYVGIRFKVTDSNFAVMKSNTLKITLDNGLSLIKFGGTDEDIEAFTTSGWKEIDAYCKCNVNEWNGHEYPQLIIEDYEIIDSCKYMF